ncbi:MAG: hypothetical protein ACLR17_06025 [Enterobacteriaceae bacterium]
MHRDLQRLFLVLASKPERRGGVRSAGRRPDGYQLFSVILGFLKVGWGLFTPFNAPFTVMGPLVPFLVLFVRSCWRLC